jgi:hypothetical protein
MLLGDMNEAVHHDSEWSCFCRGEFLGWISGIDGEARVVGDASP